MPTALQSISELAAAYKIADKSAREVAQFRSAVAVPAINELRYAGHHLLLSLDGTAPVLKPDDIRKATNHCERAMYDAAEAGIIFAIEEIACFQIDYKNVVVSRVVTDYPEIRGLAIRAQETLAQGRDARESAQTQASEYMDLFRSLRDAVHRLNGARDDLNAMLKKDAEDDRRFLLKFVIGVLGVLITASALVWRISGAAF